MAHTNQTVRSHNSALSIPWFRQVLGITAFLCLGFASEGLAAPTTSPTAQTFYAVQGATNPPNQTITVTRTSSSPAATLTASDTATWLSVSPTTTSMNRTASLTVKVNTSGRGAGTYRANITVKVGTWYTKVVPVTLIISPATQPPPPPTTSTATLAWNAVTGTPVSGYKVYVGEAPRLYTRTINVSTTSSTVNSLVVGRTYYFAVTAYNSAGESTPSNEVSKTIQ